MVEVDKDGEGIRTHDAQDSSSLSIYVGWGLPVFVFEQHLGGLQDFFPSCVISFFCLRRLFNSLMLIN